MVSPRPLLPPLPPSPRLSFIVYLRHACLRYLYFTDLSRFARCELESQAAGLHTLMMGLKGKQYQKKRATLRRQVERVELRIKELPI